MFHLTAHQNKPCPSGEIFHIWPRANNEKAIEKTMGKLLSCERPLKKCEDLLKALSASGYVRRSYFWK